MLVSCWSLGVAVERLIPASPFPPSVTGMVVLWIGLERGWIPERRVRTVASFLVRYLGLWFVPIGVGIVGYGDLVRRHAGAIVVTIGVGTALALATSACAAFVVARRLGATDDDEGTGGVVVRSEAS